MPSASDAMHLMLATSQWGCMVGIVRTTLTIDDDVYQLVLGVAQATRVPVGKVVSAALRSAYREPNVEIGSDGIPVILSSPGSPPITANDVKRASQEEDLAYAGFLTGS
jgi:hypothetical protein